MEPEQLSIRDRREPKHFWADNELVDDYLPRIGIYGFSVYMLLCRYAKDGRATPSISLIAKKLGIAKNTVRTAIETLVNANLILREKRTTDDPRVNDTNLYIILTVKGVVHGVNQGSSWGEPGVVHGVNPNNTNTQDSNTSRPNGRPSLGNPGKTTQESPQGDPGEKKSSAKRKEPFATVLHVDTPLNGTKTVNGVLWEGVVYIVWQRPPDSAIPDSTRRFAGKFVKQLMTDHPDVTLDQAKDFKTWLTDNKSSEFSKKVENPEKYSKWFDDFLASAPIKPEMVEDPELSGTYITKADLEARQEAAAILAQKVKEYHAKHE